MKVYTVHKGDLNAPEKHPVLFASADDGAASQEAASRAFAGGGPHAVVAWDGAEHAVVCVHCYATKQAVKIRPGPNGEGVGYEKGTLDSTPASEPCPKCDGCGRVANTRRGEPWSAWEEMPLGSAGAVLTGIVRPVTCSRCNGLGVIPMAAPPPSVRPEPTERPFDGSTDRGDA